MIGSAFIVSDNTWACSNEVELQIHSELVDPQDIQKGTRQKQALIVKGMFGHLEKGQKVDMLLKPDNESVIFGFNGTVKIIGEKIVTINILTKTNKIKEILSNITLKIKGHGN